MLEWRRSGWSLQRLAIEGALQNRFDAVVGTSAGGHRSLSGRFQAFVRIVFAQAQNAQARAVAHFGMGLTFQDGSEQLGRRRAYRLGPVDQARGRPGEVFPMGLRTTLRHP